jgi:CheY-like chemotaxis protein
MKSVEPFIQSVLLADDDHDDHYFFRDALQHIRPQIKLNIVNNGVDLLDLLTNYVPDILFLDLDMPIKNGLECLTEIRGNENTRELPVVVFSSTTRPVNIDTAYDLGADLFFIKPSTFSDLTASLEALLSLEWQNRLKVREQYCVNGRYTAFM